MIPMKKEGVMSIISAFKPTKVGGTIDAPSGEEKRGDQKEESSSMAVMKASMSAFIKAVKAGDVEAAVEAYISLHEDTDEMLEGGMEECESENANESEAE